MISDMWSFWKSWAKKILHTNKALFYSIIKFLYGGECLIFKSMRHTADVLFHPGEILKHTLRKIIYQLLKLWTLSERKKGSVAQSCPTLEWLSFGNCATVSFQHHLKIINAKAYFKEHATLAGLLSFRMWMLLSFLAPIKWSLKRTTWQAAYLWSLHQNWPHSPAHLSLFCLLWTAYLLNNLLVRLLWVSEKAISLLWQLVARGSGDQPLEVLAWWGWWRVPPSPVYSPGCVSSRDWQHTCVYLWVPFSVASPEETVDGSARLTWRLFPQCEG